MTFSPDVVIKAVASRHATMTHTAQWEPDEVNEAIIAAITDAVSTVLRTRTSPPEGDTMRNPSFEVGAFANQHAVHTTQVANVAHSLMTWTEQLSQPAHQCHPYAVDHADEHLKQAARELRDAADKLDRLRAYTNYPPSPEQLYAEAEQRYGEAAIAANRAHLRIPPVAVTPEVAAAVQQLNGEQR